MPLINPPSNPPITTSTTTDLTGFIKGNGSVVSADNTTYISNSLVDAKGDLITATADNTPARLAVGSDGYVPRANSGATNGIEWTPPYNSLAYQCIINGGFTVNQRVYVSNATLAAGVYGHDRWKAGAGGGDYTFTQLAQATQITIKTGKTLIQVIEDKNVIGGTYTLSWTGTAQARFGINSATPSGAYAASPITITTQTAGTVMSVEFNEGTLGQVNLSNSSVSLPFMPKSSEEELRACQRYYYNITPGIFATTTTPDTTLNIYLITPVEMRTNGTVNWSASFGGFTYGRAATKDISAGSNVSATKSGNLQVFAATVVTGANTYCPGWAQTLTSANISAEL